MAITISTFIVSNDKATITLNMSTELTKVFTGITLWTESTYKNPLTGVDLSSLIVGSSETEAITITAAAAGVSSFEGIYFAEITSNEPGTTIVATAPLRKYYTVMAYLLANIDLSCLNCNSNYQNALLLDLYIQAMKNSLLLGRFQDAITFLNRVNLYTSTTCDACDKIDPVVSTAGAIVSIGVIDCVLTTT